MSPYGVVTGERHRARNGVIDVDKFHFEYAQLHLIARLYDPFRNVLNAVFLNLIVREHQRQFRAVNGSAGIEFFQKIGNAADVILMAVRQQNPFHLILILDKIGNVGDYQIDARHILVIGKGEPRVDDDDIAAVFDGGHIFSDFSDAAEEQNFDRLFLFESASFLFSGNRRVFYVRLRHAAVRGMGGNRFFAFYGAGIGIFFPILRPRSRALFIRGTGIPYFPCPTPF